MFKRSMLRILTAVVVLVAAVVGSVQVAFATQVGDWGGSDGSGGSVGLVPAVHGHPGLIRHAGVMYPIVPPPLPVHRPVVPSPSAPAAGVGAGMDWQLAVAAALFVLAVALLIVATFQRRHAAHT